MIEKKLVYIAHPIGGDVENNIAKIKAIYKQLSVENKVIPFVPYLTTVQVLDDDNPSHRKIGFDQNKYFFRSKIIDELWVYGISAGVKQEMAWALEYRIKIVSKEHEPRKEKADESVHLLKQKSKLLSGLTKGCTQHK